MTLEIIVYAKGDFMDYEIKRIKEDFKDHFKQLGDLYAATYYKFYLDAGALNWEEKYATWYFNAFHNPPDYLFSAWKGDELIATTLGTKFNLKLDDEIDLTSISLGLTATKPQYQRQGIQKALLAKLIEAAKKDGIDLIYGFPQGGYYGSKLLKDHFGFVRLLKNAEHLIKILHDHGRWVLQHYRGLNIALAKLAVVYAVIPEDKLMGGKIRDGDVNSDDIQKVVDIQNSYTKRMPLVRINWAARFKNEVIKSKEIINFYPDWRYYWLVWEKDGDILGSINIRVERVTFKKGISSVGLLSHSVFKEGVTDEEKLSFFAEIIRKFHEEVPDAPKDSEEYRLKKLFTLQTTQPQFEAKMFKDAKCNDDTSKYEFLILPLTEKAEQIKLRYKKIKEFYIPYYR